MLPNLWLLDAEGKVLRHYEDYTQEALPGMLEEIQRAVQQASAPAATATTR